MKRLETIRKQVFGMKQVEFAAMIGIRQQAYSHAERNDRMPSRYMEPIRNAAKDRGIAWDDRWFFEIPEAAE